MFGEFGEVFDLARGDAGETGSVDRLHDSAAVEGATENLELRAAEDIAEVGDFHAEAGVRLVTAETVHGILIGQAGKGRGDFHPFGLAEDGAKDFFHEAENIVLCNERGLDIELSKLRLAVGTEVFIAEAAGDLKILFHTGDHEELLVLLRGLRESVESTGCEAGWHKKIAGALGGAFGKNRRFDFEEALGVHHIAHGFHHAVAEAQVAAHLLATQIEVAISQAEIFVGNLIVELERQDLGGVQDIERGGDDFNRASIQLSVFRPSETGHDFAYDTDDILTAQFMRFFGGLGMFLGTKNNLCDPFPVAEVDEDESAMVAARGHPAAESDFVAGVFGAKGVAVVGAVGHGGVSGIKFVSFKF